MKKESLKALGAVPANEGDLPDGLLEALREDGIGVYKVPGPFDQPGPVILHQGVYRVYQKPSGDLRVQYKRDDSDEEEFFEIPMAFVRLAEKMESGNLTPMQMIKEMMSVMGSLR